MIEKRFTIVGFRYLTVYNGGCEPTHIGQLKLQFGEEVEPTEETANGVGAIDTMFKCLTQHVDRRRLFPKGLKLENFLLHSVETGSEAPALACSRLTHDGNQADGDSRNQDIFFASLNALIAAVNELLCTDSSANPRPL